MRIRRNATRRKACRRMPTAYRRQRTQHRRNAFTRAPRKAAVSFKHQTASTRMTRIAAMHRLPWGSPAPMYVRFAIPRTEKRQMPLLGAARPAATQYTYTLHYDANGGSGAPPSQSETSSELSVWIPISEKIPTRDGYTFKVGRIARMRIRDIFAKRDIIGIT